MMENRRDYLPESIKQRLREAPESLAEIYNGNNFCIDLLKSIHLQPAAMSFVRKLEWKATV